MSNERKSWKEMNENEKFSNQWNNVMEGITFGYAANPNAKCFDLSDKYLVKDYAFNILSILVCKGLIDNFEIGVGIKEIKVEGKKKKIVGLNKVLVYGVNPQANEGKYIKSFNYAIRLLNINSNLIVPMSEIIGEVKEKDEYELHIEDEFVKNNVEKISKEDRVKRKVKSEV